MATAKVFSARAALPTIEEIRTALGLPDDSKDAAIASMLASTIAMVESYLGRGIVRAEEIEHIDPPDSRLRALLLYRFPIASVASVTQEGIELTGYRIQAAAGILKWRGEIFRAWHCCREDVSIVVTYVGGYADDAWPADLLDAVMHAFYGRWESTGGSGNPAEIDTGGAIRSVAVDGMTVTRDSPSYAGSAFAESVVPPELASVAGALDPYRVRRAGGV